VTSRHFGLLPAAGSGSRFLAANAATNATTAGPKQYQRVAGRTLLWHAVASLLAAAEVELVFVVLSPDDAQFRAEDWSAFGERMAPLYCGGATRRDSVRNGLIAAGDVIDADDWVLVHDAARPCLTAADLRRLIDSVRGDEIGGLLAVPVADTLKRADTDRRIAATEPRDGLWQAQTPQMFRHGLLLRSLVDAEARGPQVAGAITDEASAIELLGLAPKLVEGSARNLKVTYAADLELAALILQSATATHQGE
jgi:2-C-methyl-D-erythritol 4-phosphate cytidylyltransferase